MLLNLDGRGALYQQIARHLRQAIIGKDLPRGMRLPGSRRLARELRVSRNAVMAAYEQLLAEGYIESQAKSGTFVSSALPDDGLRFEPTGHARETGVDVPPGLGEAGARIVAAAENGMSLAHEKHAPDVNFEYGVAVPDRQALAELRRFHDKVIREPVFDYPDPAGDIELRTQLARLLRLNRGVHVSPSQIIVTSGSQQGLDLCARLFLDPGSQVVIEDPHYQGARCVFQAAGAELVCSPVDAHGLNPDTLPDPAPRVRLIYITPSHQFPMGGVMPLSRRLDLLAWAARNKVLIIEDDYDSEFRYDCKPLEAIAALASPAANQVIYLGTFAKSLSPSLRLGFLAVPSALASACRSVKWLNDRGSALVYQRMLALFIRNGGYEKHLRRMSRRYSARRECLVNSLQERFGSKVIIRGSNAGLHMTIALQGMTPKRAEAMIGGCRQAGVGVYSMGPYYLKAPPEGDLLLGFSGVTETQIREGVERIGRVYDRLRTRAR